MSTFYPSPPPNPQPRRVLSGQNAALDIPRSYPSPPHQQTAASPYNPHLRYNPALYNNNTSSPVSPYNPRVASASPHRSGEYNPQNFGGLEYGRVVTPPVQQFRPQTTGDPPPPPYSPPASSANTPAQAPPPRQPPNIHIQRIQTQSWGQQGASPSASSPMTPYQFQNSNVTTPSTASTFSPLSPFNQSTTSSQGTTPLSPYSHSGSNFHQRRGYSPPAPTSGLQHQASLEAIVDAVPPPPPGPPPQHQQQQQQQQQHQQNMPPPPPGPPPARMESPHRSSLQNGRNESPAHPLRLSSPPVQSTQQRISGPVSHQQPPQASRSPVPNEMYPRGSSLATSMGNRVAPSVSTTTVTATGQFQQPPQPQYQQPQAAPQNKYQEQSQAPTQQYVQASPNPREYHTSQTPQLAPAPPPPPKRKMSIDSGHDAGHLRQSPRLTIPGQPMNSSAADARSPIEPSNNPWRGILAQSSSPTKQPPRQLLTPPPTQDSSDLLDLGASEVGDVAGKDYFQGAAARHAEMISAEKAAKSDSEAMEIFINYMKQEWQLRESKYGADNMKKTGAKVGLVLRRPRESVVPDLPSISDGDIMMGGTGLRRDRSKNSGRPSLWWGQHYGLRSGEDSNPVSPTTGGPIGFSSLSGIGRNKGPKSLLSAAFESTVDDGERSRGRQSSRWWEHSVNGDSASEFGFVRSDGVGVGVGARGGRRMTKSSLRDIAMEATNRYSVISAGTVNTDAASYMGRAEYPPDFKHGVAPSSGISTGYAQQGQQPSQPVYQQPQYAQPLQAIQEQPVQTPRRPIVRLDILPLLTLLPPYPRSFPAVNNSHPELAQFRNLVRNLNELEELQKVTKDFNTSAQKIKETNAMEARKRRHQHSEAVQKLYQEGKINFDQVDTMDKDFENDENDRKVGELKAEFERFQKEVVDIVHSGLMERISLANEAYEQVQAEVVGQSALQNASNRDQEGEEIPEFLEKLTLLKWLFDVREILYREVYELLKDRNRRYKEVIVTPFYNMRQGDRIREAEEFFSKDEQGRKLENEKASLKRFEEFLEVMEENVIKGVEVQISCFWDIAPLVSESFAKIPHDLENVQPIVPPEEAHENPGYEENPLMYLKEKVFFAERSCYQFVEAQTNLLCLLHEVKTAAAKAKWRVKEAEGQTGTREDETAEEKRLTDDLKEKVKLLESEWNEAIGKQFEEVRERLERQVVGTAVVEA